MGLNLRQPDRVADLAFIAGHYCCETDGQRISTTHAASATYPLYAGRWVHLAGTMKSGTGWTNLSAFVNGNLVAWKNESAYTAKDVGNLYLGWDKASGSLAKFKGLVDEFRLYKITLSRDSIRGLLWFLKGANNVVLPQGVFYDSKLYGKLNASSLDQSSPFAGATAYGNTNTLSSNLNGRVIQMVIAKNLTLAQAWGILDLARTQNKTGNVTAFPFFATSEFYTLGLAWEVSKLSANTSVVNGGNWTVSPPPPPPNLWQLFWNTVAGFAAYVWNAAVAVGAFFVNVGKWLAQAALAYVKGLTTGDWTDFKNNVLAPLRKALDAFMSFVTTWVNALLSAVINPLLARLSALIHPYMASLGMAFTSALSEQEATGKVSTRAISDINSRMFSSTFFAFAVVGAAITAVFIALSFIPAVGLIAAAIATIIAVVILVALFASSSMPKIVELINPTKTPRGVWGQTEAFLQSNVHSPADFASMLATFEALFDLGASFFGVYILSEAVETDWSGWMALGTGMVVTLLTMFMTVWIYQNGHSPQPNKAALDMLSIANVAWAGFGIILGIVGLFKLKGTLKAFAAVEQILSWVALAFGIGELIVDSG